MQIYIYSLGNPNKNGIFAKKNNIKYTIMIEKIVKWVIYAIVFPYGFICGFIKGFKN